MNRFIIFNRNSSSQPVLTNFFCRTFRAGVKLPERKLNNSIKWLITIRRIGNRLRKFDGQNIQLRFQSVITSQRPSYSVSSMLPCYDIPNRAREWTKSKFQIRFPGSIVTGEVKRKKGFGSLTLSIVTLWESCRSVYEFEWTHIRRRSL